MQTPPTHERLVAQLIADVQPVRPLWSPRTRLALWLVMNYLVAMGEQRHERDRLRAR